MLLRRILRAPFTARTWTELAYAVLSVPAALIGAAYALASFALGAVLAVTALGVPLLALAVPAARGLGSARRGLARAVLGERVEAPEPFRPEGGRIRAGLRDGAGWRAMAYLALSPLVAALAFWVAVATWAWGLVSLTFPLQHALGLNQMTAPDGSQGLVVGDLALTTEPELALVSAAGAALLLLAPWAVRAAVLLDRLLIRTLLGPGRVARLRRTRALAVDDAAAVLRRVERDLHDGVQARLVALAVNLSVIGEAIGPNAPELARTVLRTARDNAKAAIADLRGVVRGIHPPVLDNGLADALASLAGQGSVPVELRVELPVRPSPAIEAIAYFCVAELLTNIAKHHPGGGASVTARIRRNRLRLAVRDDGPGGADPARGSGLSGLADRVATVDGTLRLRSPLGGPTVVELELPLRT